MVLFSGVKPQEEWEAVQQLVSVVLFYYRHMYLYFFLFVSEFFFLRMFISVTEAFLSQTLSILQMK